jgi:hypothetical protein
MHVIARPGRQPLLNFGVLMGGVVVHHQMDIKVLGDIGVDLLEKPEKLLMAVAGLTPGQHLAGGDVQGGKERGGAVPHIVMGHPLHVAQSHGQDGLGAVQGLNLGFFVDAQDHGLVRRIEIESHDVPDLLHEEGIGGEFEVLLPMGLQAEGSPDAVHRGFGEPGLGSQGPNCPMSSILGLGLQCLTDESGHLLIVNGARTAGLGLIVQTGEALMQEAPAPLPDRVIREAKLLGDGGVTYTKLQSIDNL